MKRLIFAAIMISCLFILGACTNARREAALLGTWSAEVPEGGGGWIWELTFAENNRFTDRFGHEGTFQVNGNNLTLYHDELGYPIVVQHFAHQGTLTITTEDADGMRRQIVLERQE